MEIEQTSTLYSDKYFSEEGQLKKIDSINFEYRQSQEMMARIVEETLFCSKHTVIEAPTGVGKSFAYLIPAIYYSKITGEKIIIATDTNTLLDQLENKDAKEIVKLVKQVEDVEFSSGIKISSIRGKANYLCIRRSQMFFQESNNIFMKRRKSDREKLIKDFELFRTSSKYGSKSEIKHGAKLLGEIWSEICINEDMSCSIATCPYRQTDCKYYSALIKKVASSDIILTNHSLLLSDVFLRNEDEKNKGEDAWNKEFYVLPHFRNLIIDEAHNLYKNCEHSLSIIFSFLAIKQTLTGLIRSKNNFFMQLSQASLENFSLDQASEAINAIEESIRCFNIFNTEFLASLRKYKNGDFDTQYDEVNLSRGFLTEECEKAAADYLNSFYAFTKSFNPLQNKDNAEIISQIEMNVKKILEQNEVLSIILEQRKINEIPYACICTAKKMNQQKTLFRGDFIDNEVSFQISAVPVFAGKILFDILYSKLNSFVLTSATLNANDDFKFFKNYSGLKDDEKLETHSMPLVFDYKNNMVEVIVEGINTQKNDEAEYISAAEFISKSINAARGRTLCLFSSYYALKKISGIIEKDFPLADGLELLVQERSSISVELIRKFKENENISLFATSSFWEGVDFPGDTLQLLIIHKIPFRVPQEINKEQEIELKKEGKSIFMDFEIPYSIIKLKQGIGRLLRTKTDKGVVAILDSRLTDSSVRYSKRILNSIYLGNTIIAGAKESVEHIEKFFNNLPKDNIE